MENNNQALTPEQVKQNYYKKQRASAMANMNRNNARRIQASQQADPELFNFVESLAAQGGLPRLKQLHVMLSDFIVMAEYNGGQ